MQRATFHLLKGLAIKIQKRWAGEMAQWVRVLGCSSEGSEFKSQQPHGGLNQLLPLLGCLKTATVYLHIIRVTKKNPLVKGLKKNNKTGGY